MTKIVPPSYKLKAFTCPHCNAFAHQKWYELFGFDPQNYVYVGEDEFAERYVDDIRYNDFHQAGSYEFSQCSCCSNIMLWHEERYNYDRHSIPVYPVDINNQFLPNDDLDDDIKHDFWEAASIVQISPRGAAALLRLCLEKLFLKLGRNKKHIFDSIENLKSENISVEVIEAMHAVRIVGNNAVHPGTLDLEDDFETASMLFELINYIADQMITKPKKRDEFFNKISSTKQGGA